MTLTKNTLRFYLRNRIFIACPIFMIWMDFCSHFTGDKALWCILFLPALAIFFLLGAYVTENPNSSEYLFFIKWLNFVGRPNDYED